MLGKTASWVLTSAAILFCIAGAWVAGNLMKLHAVDKAAAEEARKNGLLAWACEGGEEAQFDCQAVISSEYGYITIDLPSQSETTTNDKGQQVQHARRAQYRVPLAQVGQAYYLFLLIWLVCTGVPSRPSRWWHLLPMVLSIGAAAASVYYLYIMFAKLDHRCPLCLIMHTLDFLLFATMVLLWPQKERGPSTQEKKAATQEAVAPAGRIGARQAFSAIMCGAAVCAMIFSQRYNEVVAASAKNLSEAYDRRFKELQNNMPLLMSALDGASPSAIAARPEAWALGAPPGAPNELVIFSDLQCPVCKNFDTSLKREYLPAWNGRLRVVFRHYPLCTDCNPSLRPDERRPRGIHPRACDAAYAAEAAGVVGGAKAFWEMQEQIFENQGQLFDKNFGIENFVALAKSLGLDEPAFRAAMNGEEVKNKIRQDVQTAVELHVRGTPAMFLNGKRLDPLQYQSPAFWRALVAAKIGQTPPLQLPTPNPNHEE